MTVCRGASSQASEQGERRSHRAARGRPRGRSTQIRHRSQRPGPPNGSQVPRPPIGAAERRNGCASSSYSTPAPICVGRACSPPPRRRSFLAAAARATTTAVTPNSNRPVRSERGHKGACAVERLQLREGGGGYARRCSWLAGEGARLELSLIPKTSAIQLDMLACGTMLRVGSRPTLRVQSQLPG